MCCARRGTPSDMCKENEAAASGEDIERFLEIIDSKPAILLVEDNGDGYAAKFAA